MTTTFSVRKQNVNTYGPITNNFVPNITQDTIPDLSSDVTPSGSETQTSRAPLQLRIERNDKKTTPKSTTIESDVYTHKFPRHHFQFTYPFDDEELNGSKNSNNQKESASDKNQQFFDEVKLFEEEAASKANTTSVPLYMDYSAGDGQVELQTQSSNEDQLEDEKPTERSLEKKSPFYDFFHSEAPGETTPKPKEIHRPDPEFESEEHDEAKSKKSTFGGDKFIDIPNPFADPNFDFNGFLQELKASQAQHQQLQAPEQPQEQQQQQQPQQEQEQQNTNESNDNKGIVYANQAIPRNVYRPYKPYSIIPVRETTTHHSATTLHPYSSYQTTYSPSETIKHLESDSTLPLVIRNALKTLHGPRDDQPYQSHTAPKPVQTKLGPSYTVGYSSPMSGPTYKSNERGPQTFKNSHLVAYDINTHKSDLKPGQTNQKSSVPKIQVKHVPVVATDDYYYYYYDDEPQQTKQQVKAPSTSNKVEVANNNKNNNNNNKKPKLDDDEYYYYEYYEYPEEKNKTSKNQYDYLLPPKNNKSVGNKAPPKNPYISPNSLSSQKHSTYKSPNDYFTIKPIHVPLTTTPYPIYVPKQRTLYTTAKPVTTVKTTVSYNRQRLTTITDGDLRRNQPNFYR